MNNAIKYLMLITCMSVSIVTNASPSLCLKDRFINSTILNDNSLTFSIAKVSPGISGYQIIAHSSGFQFLTDDGMLDSLAWHLEFDYAQYCGCTFFDISNIKIAGLCGGIIHQE